MRTTKQLIGIGSALVMLTVGLVNAAPQPGTARLTKHDFKAWPKSDVAAFGCFLEREFRSRDEKFNCSLKGYENRGDPCRNTKAYYEGPRFPQHKAKDVHPLFQSIELGWEHGQLQNLIVTLSRKMAEKDVRQTLGLPENVSVQPCSATRTCIVLIGFDHMGAGESQCKTN